MKDFGKNMERKYKLQIHLLLAAVLGGAAVEGAWRRLLQKVTAWEMLNNAGIYPMNPAHPQACKSQPYPYCCQPQINNSLPHPRAGPEGPNGLREQHLCPTSKPIGLAICVKDIDKQMKWNPYYSIGEW